MKAWNGWAAVVVAGEWTALTNRAGTGDMMRLTDRGPETGLRAYRVGVSLPQ